MGTATYESRKDWRCMRASRLLRANEQIVGRHCPHQSYTLLGNMERHLCIPCIPRIAVRNWRKSSTKESCKVGRLEQLSLLAGKGVG